METVRRVSIFEEKGSGYLGNHPNWWFDEGFEYSFSIFDLNTLYGDTYFAKDHVLDQTILNYVDCVLSYGEYFLNRKVRSVVEFGCGAGWFTKEFLNRDIDVIAIEGTLCGYRRTVERGVPPERVMWLDLRRNIDLQRRFDFALCTEVAEHVECPFSGQLISNVTKHSDLVLFSSEGPGTNEDHIHHCNEQPELFWRNIFKFYGYRMYPLPDDVFNSVQRRARAIFYSASVTTPPGLKHSPGETALMHLVPGSSLDQVRRYIDT
jgi:hypothetical protein